MGLVGWSFGLEAWLMGAGAGAGRSCTPASGFGHSEALGDCGSGVLEFLYVEFLFALRIRILFSGLSTLLSNYYFSETHPVKAEARNWQGHATHLPK
jgi:hypothetical protein